MNERVRIIRKALKLTLEQFGTRLGVKKAAISKIENGDNKLSEQMQKSICREFNVNPAYLISGVGEMFVETDNGTYSKIDKIMAGENEMHRTLLKWVAALDEKDIDDIIRIMDKFKDIAKTNAPFLAE